MPKKSKYVQSKIFEKKIKSPFMIYADFESILVPQENGKQNPKDSYTNKYQKHIACSYGYKLVCVDDKFSKPFNNFINNMIKEKKYCSGVMKTHFKKELVMTKEDSYDFKNSYKYWIYDNDYIDNDIKVRDHCHIAVKCRDSGHINGNINLILNYKTSAVFNNLKNYDFHLIKQLLGKFSFKINVIQNGEEKYKSFTINNKSSFLDNFQFLSSSLDSLFKT